MSAIDLEDTVPEDLSFYRDDRGRRVLISTDEEVAEFRAKVEDAKAAWTAQRALLGADSAAGAAELDRLIAEADAEMARIEGEHKARIAQATIDTYHIAPYSYYDRMEAEDKFTRIDPDTQESVRKEDRVRDALLVGCVRAYSRKDDGGKLVTYPLTPEEVRRLPGPVAIRLWGHAKEWSEPSEAETFRVRLGPR